MVLPNLASTALKVQHAAPLTIMFPYSNLQGQLITHFCHSATAQAINLVRKASKLCWFSWTTGGRNLSCYRR